MKIIYFGKNHLFISRQREWERERGRRGGGERENEKGASSLASAGFLPMPAVAGAGPR